MVVALRQLWQEACGLACGWLLLQELKGAGGGAGAGAGVAGLGPGAGRG